MFKNKVRIKELEYQVDTLSKQVHLLIAFITDRGLLSDLQQVVDRIVESKTQEEANKIVH